MAEQFNYQNQQSAEVQNAVSAALEEQKKKKRKKRLIVLLIILAVIIVGGIIISSGDNGDSSKSTQNNSSSVSSDESGETVDARSSDSDKNTIGDFKCVVKEAKICKNWEGKDAVKITYSFTNNSSDSASFDIALDDEVYQDGIQLESSFISSDDDDWGIDVKIKPGMSKDVSKVYILRDKNTDLEVEISELISFSDDKIVTTVKLKK